VTKGGPRKRKRARKRASVGGGEDERESTGESLGCLSASLLLLSFFPLALLPWEITDTPLAPPRSRVSLRALAPPTHRAGATRRGRCDTTGREARKEDLDAERLCMVLRSRKRGGKGGWVALGEISDGDRTGFFYFFFSESLAKPITLFPLFLFSERDPSQEKEQSPLLFSLSPLAKRARMRPRLLLQHQHATSPSLPSPSSSSSIVVVGRQTRTKPGAAVAAPVPPSLATSRRGPFSRGGNSSRVTMAASDAPTGEKHSTSIR